MDVKPERECSECQKTFVTKSALNRHLISHDVNAKVKCEICRKIYKNPAALAQHVKHLHTKRDRPSCDICHRLFCNPFTLRNHLNHVHSTRERPRFPCVFPNCEKIYRCKSSVLKHVKIYHTENPALFPCTLCGKEFRNRSNLESHISTHTTEKLYKCVICEKSFTLKMTMKKHEATHIEKSSRSVSKCHLCSQAFLHRNSLERHIRTVHENQRNYPCTFCDKRFKTGAHLRVHVESVHPANKEIHSCDRCEYQGPSKTNLARHKRRHNITSRHQCYFCKKQYADYGTLVDHCGRVHTLEM